MTETYKLGEVLYRATIQRSETEVSCPDCFGRRHLVVILGDDSRVTIACSTCSRGYEPPRGFVKVEVIGAVVESVIVSKIEQESNNGASVVFYSGNGFYRVSADDLFTNVETAQVRADTLALEYQQDQRERAKRKEKDGKTWAWHVTYHRRGIKDAQRQLEHHTGRLTVALEHKKGEQCTHTSSASERVGSSTPDSIL